MNIQVSPFVAGPVWREDEDDCWTSEIQIVGGHAVVATVHGGSEAEVVARRDTCLAALVPKAPSEVSGEPVPQHEIEAKGWRANRAGVSMGETLRGLSAANREAWEKGHRARSEWVKAGRPIIALTSASASPELVRLREALENIGQGREPSTGSPLATTQLDDVRRYARKALSLDGGA